MLTRRAKHRHDAILAAIGEEIGVCSRKREVLRNRRFVRYLILARHSLSFSSSERTCESRTLCSAAMPLLENSAEAFLSRFCCQSRIATFVALWAVDTALPYVCMQA